MAGRGVISEEESLIPKPMDMLRNISPGKQAKKKKKKKKRQASCFSMLTNFKFLFFIANTVGSIGLFLWWLALYPDTQVPYIISGIAGLLVTVTGYRTFTQLLDLTTKTNEFEQKNKVMRDQHRAISKEVNKIKNANGDLRHTEHRLRNANAKNQQNLTNFRDIQGFMQEMDIKDFKVVTERAKQIGHSWQNQLLQKERDMLHLIFDRYEMNHESRNEHGMTEEDFNKFAACLPDAYRERFARMGTFEKMSNKKGIMEYADFELCLDTFAEMVVNDVDIEVEIRKSTVNLQDVPVQDYHETLSDESDEEEQQGMLGGFMNRVNSWRKTRKQEKIRNSAQVRTLVVKSASPVTKRSSPDNYNASQQFNMLDNAQKQEEKKREKETKLAPPRIKKTKSQINAIHDIDQVSLNDDEINAYMAQQ
eukprot:63717_1